MEGKEIPIMYKWDGRGEMVVVVVVKLLLAEKGAKQFIFLVMTFRFF